MKKLGSQILKNFKGNYQEVEKGILNPSKLDNSKYDIFSTAQITEYLGNVIKKNEGMALEIQKSVVANVKSELSHLIPVNIKHNGTVKKFYVVKAGVCTELSKALEPVNKKEGYFEEKSINEDDVLKFIDENEEVDDDALVKEFGEEVTEILNSLEEDGKLDVDEDGFYFVTDETEGEGVGEGAEEGEGEGEGEGAKEGEGEGEGEGEEARDEKGEGAGEAREDEGAGEGEGAGAEEGEGEGEEEGQQGGEGEGTGAAGGGTQEINFDGEGEGAGAGEGSDKDAREGENLGEGVGESEGEGLGEGEDAGDMGEGAGEDAGEDMGEGEGEGLGEGEGMGEGVGEGEGAGAGAGEGAGAEMTPEELEAYAKKTATVTLLKFYKNSTDEKLKEIAAVELKSRGITPEEGQAGAEGQQPGTNGDLPDNKAALDALETFTKNYLGDYDKEDLVNYVVELANQSPAKRKELKELYKEYYSMNNQGNSLLKVNEDEFKEFLTDHYFNNFTPGDLQSYAYLMISKNPKEYRKFKKMMDLQNEPIV